MTSEPVNYFSRLGAEECWALLGSSDVGRVAWASEEGITVIPVNFSVSDGTITFHTRDGSKLARLVQPTRVAFEVDDIDLETTMGWSVLVRGITEAADAAPKAGWLLGREAIAIAITSSTISGRVVSGYRK